MLTRRYFPRVTAGETSCNTLKELLDLLYFRTIKSLVHLLITDLSKSKSIEILNRLRVLLLNIILLSMYVFHVRINHPFSTFNWTLYLLYKYTKCNNTQPRQTSFEN